MHPTDTPRCFANHLGLYMANPLWLRGAVSAVRAGAPMPGSEDDGDGAEDGDRIGNIGIVYLIGPMSKGGSPKFGGCSTLDARRQLRALASDPEIAAVLLCIDSPGGQAAGTLELAAEVAKCRAAKPTWAFVEDSGDSAAYWVASQAETVLAGAAACVGSIGTYAVLTDTSGAMERAGISVTVVSTGPAKGAGVEGTPITPEITADVQRLVDAMNAHFLAGVSRGREVSPETVASWADGRTYPAAEAVEMGLIDGVATWDEAVAVLAEEVALLSAPPVAPIPPAAPQPVTTPAPLATGKVAEFAALMNRN